MFNSVGTFQTEIRLSDELTIFECGFEDVLPREPYQYEQIDYYLIHFILEGEGLFFINDEVHRLGKGEGFVIPPNTDNNYYPLSGNPWSYRWIGVKGTKCEELFQQCGLLNDSYIYQYQNQVVMDTHFKEVFDHCQNNQLYGALGKVYSLLNLLMVEHKMQIRLATSEGEKYVLAAMDIIKVQFSDPRLKIDQIANEVKVERTYLFKLFKQYITVSPQQYLIQFRLNKASELLRKTNYPIEEIAFLVGFSNASHFSKIFSKHKCLSPKKFRQQFRVMN